MFFSNEILTKKGGQFAVVWLVGNFNTVHGSKRLGLKKSDYVSVDVVKAWYCIFLVLFRIIFRNTLYFVLRKLFQTYA